MKKIRVKVVAALYNVNYEPDFLTSVIECSEDELENAAYCDILQEAVNNDLIYDNKNIIMFLEWDLDRFPWLKKYLNEYDYDGYCQFVDHDETRSWFCNQQVYADGLCKYHHPYYSLTDKEKFDQGWERIFGVKKCE